MFARLTAFALGLVGLAALRAQFDALAGLGQAVDRIWAMAGDFSVLSAGLLVVHLLALTRGWQISAARAAGLLLAMAAVALGFALQLTRAGLGEGLGWWANLALPVGYALWWLGFAPKQLSERALPVWLIWPMLYIGYALIRGLNTGYWPYGFLDAKALGWAQVALHLMVLLLVLALLGRAILALARRLQSARPS